MAAKEIRSLNRVNESTGNTEIFYPATTTDAIADRTRQKSLADVLGDLEDNSGAYDISAAHNNATYADLAAALGTNGANVPAAVRKGGMSVKFVLTSDNKYVQYRLITNQWSTNVIHWQLIDCGVYIDIDKIAPLSSGYYTSTTARGAVPVIARKYGVIIQYKVSALSIRIEQFINDTNGYSLSDNCWKTLYPLVNNKTNYCLYTLISNGYKVDNGSIVADNTKDYCFFVVNENTTYDCTDAIASIEYFCGPINTTSSDLLSGNFISHADINSTTFTTPAGCCLVALNFSRRKKDRYKNTYILMRNEILNRELELQRNNLVIGALRFTQYVESNTSYNLVNGTRGDSSTYDSIVIPVIGRESYIVRNRYGQDSNVQGVLFFSGTPNADTFIESYYANTYSESNILIAPDAAKYIVILMLHRNNGNFDEIYLVQGFSVNPLIARFSGACFTEFRNRNANDNTRVSVGMLGNTEANLSYNMDYRTGVHKAYDPTKAAIWLALNGAGGAFQYSAANQPTNGDIWQSDGYRYALWFSPYQLAVNTDMNDPKGSAAIWGKRRDNQATFAGHTDCIIEGNRIRGNSGVVFINAYNNGKVIIANGGGRILLGGVEDDNATRVQISGDVKATQYKLSDLNTAPSSSTDTGAKGEIRVTENYIYVCVATNTWVRAALETW